MTCPALTALLAAATTIAAATPCFAQPPAHTARTAAHACDVAGVAFGGETIPVWSEPRVGSEPAGVLPAPDPDDEMQGRMSAEFNVVEARGGWFRIENGGPWIADASIPPPPGVSGWISGRHIDFILQTHMGFAEPDPASAVRYRNRDLDEIDILVPLDCRGEWVKLLFSDQGEVREGWFRGICEIQETSCDMAPGDAYRD
jgi:hypothetical protein